ncbi:MtnX-like HAD-IB family phosphatase [Dendrosporobacter sp. 1207_IL3150]|uniref:MtnX-like HAD-IB family phosphatase n=1 Tax=Dendrosporobacter sp. 1207_IL3150 TaxID=3084054 RepID=UPI002FDAFB4E
MKNFIFVSDFDATLTEKDFYHIVIDECLGEPGRELYRKFKSGELRDIEFLASVFKNMNRDEAGVIKVISKIKLDNYTQHFINNIHNHGGDFTVLSAGVEYYINKLFELRGISNAPVIANHGYYADRGIKTIVDEKSSFYSELYGIDKARIVQSLRTKYKKIYYAGDGLPDYKAASLSDLVFAKSELANQLSVNGQNFVPFNCFKEIDEYLKKNEF